MREPAAIVFRISTHSASEPIAVPRIRPGIASYNVQSYVGDRVRQVFQEAGYPNWDTEGAHAVGLKTVLAAERLGQGLPPLTAKPAVFAQHSGKISLQWVSREATRDAVVVSVDEHGGITYATSCANGQKTHGAEIFSGTPPRDVLEFVLHHFVEPSPKASASLP
jgi:hypothetical protein